MFAAPLPPSPGFIAEVLDLGSIVATSITAVATIIGARFVMRGELEKSAASRETVAWEAVRDMNDDLLGRVKSLESDRARMQGEISALHEKLVAHVYVVAYARLLLESWPPPPAQQPPRAHDSVQSVLFPNERDSPPGAVV